MSSAGRNRISSCFQHGLQDGYLSLKPHVKGGLFPLTLLQQVLTAGQPQSLYNSLTTRGDIHHRLTRQADRLDRPVIRTESGRRRFLFSAVAAHNGLPQTLRDMSPRRFSRNLREYLLAAQNDDD